MGGGEFIGRKEEDMNDETYEALKRVLEGVKHNTDIAEEDFEAVEDWVTETAKEHND